MSSARPIVVLRVDAQRYGVLLSSVEQVIRLIEYYALPNAPEVVPGVINFYGDILPVVSLRRRFRLPDREPLPSDHLVLARTQTRRVALLVDEACGFDAVSETDWVPVERILPGADYIAWAAKREDGLILIHDLDTCLSLDETRALDTALAQAPRP